MDTKMSPVTMLPLLRLLLPKDQFPLRLTNLFSKCTDQVSSTVCFAERNLTMVSSLLVMVKITGFSRTHGEPDGVNKATCKSLTKETSVVLKCNHLMLKHERYTKVLILFEIFLKSISYISYIKYHK